MESILRGLPISDKIAESIMSVLGNLALGGAVLAVPILGATAFRLARFFYSYFIRRSTLDRYTLGRKYYAWALVTGASDGIGLQLADRLCAKGFNIVLHGRNPEKLSKIIYKLQQDHAGAQFRAVVADASTGHGMKAAIEGIVKDMEGLPGPLTVLVNNLGGMSNLFQENKYRPLWEYQSADVDWILNVNLRFPVQLTRALLPLLMRKGEAKAMTTGEKPPALIMSIGSISSFMGGPFITAYVCGKAFVPPFTKSLEEELKLAKADVEVLALRVAQVTDTSGFDIKPSLFTPTSRTLAKSALDRVGCGYPVTFATWAQEIQTASVEYIPDKMLMSMVTERMLKIKRRDDDEQLKSR